MADNILYDLGVDLHSSFQFVDGDLMLSSYNDNIVQSVVNRLRTELGELDWFYEDYGTILRGFLGWKAKNETLRFMESEIKTVLNKEPRLANHNCVCSYRGNGKIGIKLSLYPIEDVQIDVNLVLTTTGAIELETDEITIEGEV